jgi:hypothetical protein
LSTSTRPWDACAFTSGRLIASGVGTCRDMAAQVALLLVKLSILVAHVAGIRVEQKLEQKQPGYVSAAYETLARTLQRNASDLYSLTIDESEKCTTVSNGPGDMISVVAPNAVDLVYGVRMHDRTEQNTIAHFWHRVHRLLDTCAKFAMRRFRGRSSGGTRSLRYPPFSPACRAACSNGVALSLTRTRTTSWSYRVRSEPRPACA